MKLRNSISHKVIFILITSIIVVMSVLGILYLLSEREQSVRNIQKISNQTAERLSNNLIYPLWNVDDNASEQTVMLEMANQNITAIIVKDYGGEFYFGKIKNSKWKICDYIPDEESEDRLAQSFDILKKKIRKNGLTIGFVEIFITDYFLNQFLRNMIILDVLQIIALSIIMIMVVFLSLKNIVLNPLIVLEHAVERFRRGDFTASAPVQSQDEIGKLAGAFNTMVLRLKAGFEKLEVEIANRHRAEKQLRESEEKYRTLFESAPAGIAITTMDGEILSFNDAFMKIFRVDDRSALSGVNAKNYFPNPEKEPVELFKKIKKEEHIENYEQEFTDFSDRVFPASLSVRLIQYEGRTCTQSIITDITRIKKMEDELRDYAENLEKMVDEKTENLKSANEKLQAALKSLKETQERLSISAHQAGMAEIAASVLHNIGNAITPVNVRVGRIEETLDSWDIDSLGQINGLLQSDRVIAVANESEKLRKEKLLNFFSTLIEISRNCRDSFETDLRFIQKGLEHVKEIISIQQKYAGLRGFETEVNLNDLVKDSADILLDSFETRGIRVEFNLDDLPCVLLDKNKMIQIFVNLFKNAYEAIDRAPVGNNKKISVNTSVLKNEETEYVQVIMEDTGEGFSSEIKNDIFKFNFSTKGRGSGFGLHDSANYIKAMDGEIDLISKEQRKGTQLIIKLPVIEVRSE
ncbi:MAG: PAS domain S-box protein [Desulfobacteraceae bacterium]|nr:PAS domain S-box protein [Desulfobacteraceae bacterium]